MKDYSTLRDECIRSGRLFEDQDFPPTYRSLFFRGIDPNVKWRRPHEISHNPVFIREATYYDLHQGSLGNCWFISGINALMASNRMLFKMVVPENQNFQIDQYAGIFRFNFWHYGKWREVVVDDRLPTNRLKGHLIYGSNRKEPDEFWCPLVEKAYAKLHGCYQALDGGRIKDAFLDLTGGISESIKLKETENLDHKELFDILQKMWMMNTVIGMAIFKRNNSTIGEVRLDTGLYEGHAYAVTKLAKITSEWKEIELVCVRNPWGKGEWNGAWSDKSKEWKSLSSETRRKLGIVIENNGEFWITMQDVLKHFSQIDLCHLQTEALASLTNENKVKKNWKEYAVKDRWVRGVSAGGSDLRTASYWRNPQIELNLKNRTETTTIVISLMEIMKKGYDTANISIGFHIYKLRPNTPKPVLDEGYDRYALKLEQTAGAFTPYREKVGRFDLDPGMYIIIPCTYKAGKDSEFLIRIFSETEADNVSPAEDPTGPIDTTEVIDSKETDMKRVNRCKKNRFEKPESPLIAIFSKFAAPDKTVDASSLQKILNDLLVHESNWDKVTLETARCMLSLLDSEHLGVIEFETVQQIWQYLQTWTLAFSSFDTNRSGSINVFELQNVFETLGFSVGRKVLASIIRRYGNREEEMMLEDFIQCLARMLAFYFAYKNHLKAESSVLKLDKWLEITMYV